MKKFALFMFLCIVSVGLISAQTKDLSKKPTQFNNPVSVSGPVLDHPMSALTESFEGVTFPPAGWVKVNLDGGTGWARSTFGTTPVPGFNGGTIWAPNSSFGAGLAYATYTTGGASSNDQWLITPQLTNIQANDSLYFWMWKFGTYNDHVNIKLSTTTATPAAMTITAGNYAFVVADSGWVQYKIKIGGLVPNGSNIFIGFQEVVADNINDGAFIAVDLVAVTAGPVPVELTSFAGATLNGNVELRWSTATETNNRGFEIQKMMNGSYAAIGFISGNGTSTETHNYRFIDKPTVGKYSYRLKQIDFNGRSEFSKAVEVEITAPNVYQLSQNYPNPFNPATQINFSLASDSKVSLRVFNLIGQEVAVLFSGNLSAGNHAVNFNANRLSSGMYLYKLEATGIDGKSFSSVRKMVLNK